MYLLSFSDMSVDTVCSREPFLGTAMLSPDATKVAVIGSPEAFEGVGRNLPDDMVPSMVDNQLFLIDVATRKATPLTRDFDPSLDRMRWSRRVYILLGRASRQQAALSCEPLHRQGRVAWRE